MITQRWTSHGLAAGLAASLPFPRLHVYMLSLLLGLFYLSSLHDVAMASPLAAPADKRHQDKESRSVLPNFIDDRLGASWPFDRRRGFKWSAGIAREGQAAAVASGRRREDTAEDDDATSAYCFSQETVEMCQPLECVWVYGCYVDWDKHQCKELASESECTNSELDCRWYTFPPSDDDDFSGDGFCDYYNHPCYDKQARGCLQGGQHVRF